MPHRHRGFTLFELLLVLILVLVLFLVVVDRLLPLRGDAEAAHVAQVVGAVRAGLGLAVAERAVTDGLGQLSELDGANPIRFLFQPPSNYAGELDDASLPEPGQWAFQLAERQLLYRVRRPQYLMPPAKDPVILAWRVRVNYGDGALPSVALVPATDQSDWPKPAVAKAL